MQEEAEEAQSPESVGVSLRGQLLERTRQVVSLQQQLSNKEHEISALRAQIESMRMRLPSCGHAAHEYNTYQVLTMTLLADDQYHIST